MVRIDKFTRRMKIESAGLNGGQQQRNRVNRDKVMLYVQVR